ncbi:MAG: DUF1292 domain-containing protein [Lachnospiraceae bacterium]|nr:DUF1292 domain-containing protein [Lachnospiraceae bacterium]
MNNENYKEQNTEELTAIPFVTEDGETVNMYVLEETTIQGVHYILVTDDLSEDSEEAVVMILKEEKVSGSTDPDITGSDDVQNMDEEFSLYQPVEDDTELRAVAKVFAELMDDVEFEY